MRDLREIIATDAAVGLRPPTTEQEAVNLRHAAIRCEARLDKIHELLADWAMEKQERQELEDALEPLPKPPGGAVEGEDI
jgi:hypothetical protein